MSDALLITGVGKRAGLHLARTFLDRGQRVIGTYRTRREAIDALEAQGAELHRCDFYEEREIDALMDAVQAGHGALRGIIHNASDWLPDRGELPPAEIMHRMMQVHVTTPYRSRRCCRRRPAARRTSSISAIT